MSNRNDFIFKMAFLAMVFVVVVLLTIRGFAVNQNTVDNKTKAYIECVRVHLPAECK